MWTAPDPSCSTSQSKGQQESLHGTDLLGLSTLAPFLTIPQNPKCTAGQQGIRFTKLKQPESWEDASFHERNLIGRRRKSIVTSLFVTGCMNFMWDDIGKMLSSSSMTMHALHDAMDSKNLSLNLVAAVVWDSVRNLSWTSCKHIRLLWLSGVVKGANNLSSIQTWIQNYVCLLRNKSEGSCNRELSSPWPWYINWLMRRAKREAGWSTHRPQLSQWFWPEG
jgi:hypothetical protein